MDRTVEIKELTIRLSANAILPIYGVRHSGKTALVAQFLNSDSIRRRLTEGGKPLAEVAAIYIDLSPVTGPRPVLRRLAFALGELKRFPDAEDAVVTDYKEIRAQLLHEILLARLHERRPLAVLDDVDLVPLTNDNLDDLRALLEFTPFRHGATITVTSGPLSQRIAERMGREVKKPISIGPLSPVEGRQLLTNLLGDSVLVGETIKLIQDTPELLLPGAFVGGIAAFKSQLNSGDIQNQPSALANMVLEWASDDVLKTVQLAVMDCAAHSAEAGLGDNVTIMAMAVLARQPVTEPDIQTAQIPVGAFQRLRDQGLLQKRGDAFCLPSIISAALRVQIERILRQRTANGTRHSELTDAVGALIQSVELHNSSADDATLMEESLEEAIGWLERSQTGESLLIDCLWSAFLPHTAEDLIPPISNTDSFELLKRFGESSRALSLTTAVARLVLETRIGKDGKNFLSALKAAIEMASLSSQITVHHLRGLDGAAFSGAARYQLFTQVFDLRHSLMERLHAWAESDGVPASFKRCVASWVITTADLAFQLVKPTSFSKSLLKKAAEWLEESGKQGDEFCAGWEQAWLIARASRLAALLENDPNVRTDYMLKAVASAELALSKGSRLVNQTRFYLRMVRQLLPELPQPAQQRRAVESDLNNVEITFGPERDLWPLEIYAQFAALLRYEAKLEDCPRNRLSQLQESARFLRPAESRAAVLAHAGDTRPLLAFARLHRALARELARQGQYTPADNTFKEAGRLAELALKGSSNAAAWDFLISLENGSLENFNGARWSDDYLGGSGPQLSDSKKRVIKRCRTWLDSLEQPGIAEGRVALKCFQREWRVQGSLGNLAAEAATDEGNDWERLSADEKCKQLSKQYQKRSHKLQTVEQTYGIFVESVLVKIQLESQFQYTSALARRATAVPTREVLNLCQHGVEKFPHSKDLQFEHARFHRRIWNYGEAIVGFLTIAERCRDAADRREAAVDLIETLVTASIYNECVVMSDSSRMDKQSLVNLAHEWLLRLFDFPDVAMDVAVLSDQVQLELGKEIDWNKNDMAYESVIGGSEIYVNTVVENLTPLRSMEADSTTHLWEAVVHNFTHPEVLRGLGRLYLRSAELSRRDDPLRDAERAYGCFNACRILEVSLRGRESSVTCYGRAHAILMGARIANNPNPFDADRDRSATLLDLAHSRFSSARDRSVGSFRQAAEARLRELHALKRQFKSNSIEVSSE